MMDFKRIAYSFLLVFMLTAPLCASAQEAEDELLLGLIPEENIFKQVKRHKLLEKYLSEKLNIKVRFTILSRYHDIVSRFVSRKLDGAFFGIFTAALAHDKIGVVPLARPVNLDGGSTAVGYLFATKDSGVASIADMKGKKAAFVDKITATGYLFAVAHLREHGIKNIDRFFSEYYFTGSHDTAVYSVLAGRADVGAVKGRILDKIIQKDPLIREQIVILAKSEELPDNTLCIRKDLPPALAGELKKVLLEMHNDPEGRAVLKEMEILKFEPAEPGDFGPVRALAKKAGVDIKNIKY